MNTRTWPLTGLTLTPALMLTLLSPPQTGPAQAKPARRDDPWAIEDPAPRTKLPPYQTIPAARPDELTPSQGYPGEQLHRTWERSHGNNYNTRFSLLDQINQDNVGKLKVAWIYHSKDRAPDMAEHLQVNPIVVDGVMYGPTMGHNIVAVNAVTGKELWRFTPGGPTPAKRGLTFFRGDDKRPPRILFNAGDYLWALDPKTGKPLQSFGDKGRLKTGHFRVAPAVFGNLVIVPGFMKDVFAFDMTTGAPAWTFHTIPLKGEPGYEPGNETIVNGANCWGGMALDDQRGMVFIGTGSMKPNHMGMAHQGQNLYANSIVAVDARTGKLVWSFQEIRHDIWDLDISSPPVLVTLQRYGKAVDAVAAISKMGNTILVDRVTGKPIHPFRMRRAPTLSLPGERTWPYQPDLELPQPFAKQEFTIDDVTNISPEARDYILNKIRPMNMGWFRTFDLAKPTVLFGVLGGGEWTGMAFDPRSGYLYITEHDVPTVITLVPFDSFRKHDPNAVPTAGEKTFQAFCMVCHGADREGVGMGPPLMALDTRYKDADVIALLKTGRNGMPAAPPMTEQQTKELLDFLFDRDRPRPTAPAVKPKIPHYRSLGFQRLYDQEGYPGSKPPWGTLNAIDLSSGRIVWKVVLGEHPELTARGIPKTGTMNMGGASVTAGNLVFVSGTRDEMIRAFHSSSGDELWKYKLPFRGASAPSIYEVAGKQYVVIAATGGGRLGGELGDTYVAFTLP